MPRYNVHLQTTAHTVIEVEADSKEEAVEAALGQVMPRICAQCSGWGNEQNLELGDEWDIGDGMSLDDSVDEIES